MIESSAASFDATSQDLGSRFRKAARGARQHRASQHGTFAHKVEGGAKRSAGWMWVQLRRHPFISVTTAGAIGVVAATAIGVGELAVGAALAYAGYNVWVRGETPEEAMSELAEGLEGHAGGHH
jgi:hypothetical protein